MMSGELERDYTVGEEIGRGRYGVVSRCHSAATGECFAVKSIEKNPIRGDAVDGLCLRNEAKLTQAVAGHRNVVGAFDVYEDDEFLHVVLEYCGGGDLYERITTRPARSESEARRILVRYLFIFSNFVHSRVGILGTLCFSIEKKKKRKTFNQFFLFGYIECDFSIYFDSDLHRNWVILFSTANLLSFFFLSLSLKFYNDDSPKIFHCSQSYITFDV